jgi:hypothetical protein
LTITIVFDNNPYDERRGHPGGLPHW